MDMDEYRKLWFERASELGHELRVDADGNIDEFNMDTGMHNGPGCKKCHEMWCMWCCNIENIKPCGG